MSNQKIMDMLNGQTGPKKPIVKKVVQKKRREVKKKHPVPDFEPYYDEDDKPADEINKSSFFVKTDFLSAEQLKKARDLYDSDVAVSPYIRDECREEFKKKPVLQNFGASGMPGISWHGQCARFLYGLSYEYVKKNFTGYRGKTKFSLHPDRTSERVLRTFVDGKVVDKKTTQAGETDHRDEFHARMKELGDEGLQGWITLEDTAFELVPGSHCASEASGFKKLNEAEVAEVEDKYVRVILKAGSLMFFDPSAIHRIPKKIIPHRKVYHFYRFTDSDEVVPADLVERCKTCDTVPMPSGGVCKTFESNDRFGTETRIKPFSKNFVPEVVKDDVVLQVLRAPETYGLVTPAEYKYSDEELGRLVPKPF